MAVFGYIFLTREQDHLMPAGEQETGLQEYAQSVGITVDKFFIEENVSLKGSFKERREGKKLFQVVQPDDTIIVMRAEWILGSVRDASRLLSVLNYDGTPITAYRIQTQIEKQLSAAAAIN